ncbi:MAG: Tetratricopeptide 2 repeat protein [Myxococcales bacterium]|nr:Tetratricopeptide 2 repeat protein [Myxococcales bacterium]
MRAGWAALALACSLAACASQKDTLTGDTFDARRKLTRELINRNDWGPAFVYADALHRERPHDVETLVLRGTIYRERALWRESEGDLKEAVMIDDRSAEAHAALGILYDVTMRPALAEKQHRAAVKLAPEAAGYLNNLGFSLFLRGKPRDAIQFYEQAARLDPTSRRVRTNLGFACAATGDLRRASHEFEMGGSAAEAKNNLGFAYERRGDLKQAFDLYREATELDPKSQHARSNLVHAALVLGRPVPTSEAQPGPGSSSSSPATPATGPDGSVSSNAPPTAAGPIGPAPLPPSSPGPVASPSQKDGRP